MSPNDPQGGAALFVRVLRLPSGLPNRSCGSAGLRLPGDPL